MLKVLYLPIGEQKGTCDAFREVGVNLLVLDFLKEATKLGNHGVNRKFVSLAREFKPDLIHMQLQMTNVISPTTLSEVRRNAPGAVITNWTGDIRVRPSSPFIAASKSIDFSLLSHVGQIDMYRRAGCKNPRYWQIGYDPKLNFPKRQNQFKYDVAFAGSHYRNTFPDSGLRLSIVKKLKDRYGSRFCICGQGYPPGIGAHYIPIHKINDIYNDSLCVLSVSNFNDVEHYFSDRLLMCLASGRPTIAYRFPKYDCYFCHKNDILLANNVNEIFSMIEFCKNNREKANQVGNNGYLKAYSEHSFTSRIMELLTFTNLIGKL